MFSVAANGVLTQVSGSPFPPQSQGQPSSVEFSPSGRLLATANYPDEVETYSVGAGGALTPAGFAALELPDSYPDPMSVAFSPSGGLLATANENGNSVSEFSVAASGALTPVYGSGLSTGTYLPASVAFDPSGAFLAIGSPNRMSVFSVGSGGTLTQSSVSPCGCSSGSVAFSPSGELLQASRVG